MLLNVRRNYFIPIRDYASKKFTLFFQKNWGNIKLCFKTFVAADGRTKKLHALLTQFMLHFQMTNLNLISE